MKKIAVVTAAIGTTETPRRLWPPAPDVRWICVTDRDDMPGWEVLPMDAKGAPRLAARFAKMKATSWFADQDFVIWQDASFDLLMDPRQIADEAAMQDADVVAFVHPDRRRIREEAVEIIRLGLAPTQNVERQIGHYAAAGFDANEAPQQRLTTTGFMIFRTTPHVGVFCRVWLQQVIDYTLRDQLSVDYSAWRTGVTIGYLPGHYRDNAFARYDRERHRQRQAA